MWGEDVTEWAGGEGWFLERADGRWVVSRGCVIRLTLASMWWSDGVRRPPAVREEVEDEEQGRIKGVTPLALFKPAVINDKTHTLTHTQSTPADPCEPAAQTASPGSLAWSLSQHFWLMSDFFPTTYYGNSAERDEELRLCSCSAQLADPTEQAAAQSQCLLLKVDVI